MSNKESKGKTNENNPEKQGEEEKKYINKEILPIILWTD